MVEKMHDQAIKAPVSGYSFDACLIEGVIQVRLCNGARPLYNFLIKPHSMCRKISDIREKQLVEAFGGRKLLNRCQSQVISRVPGESL
jgi:hypothetical protein